MKIIAVFGKSGVGKGTVATMLCMMDDRLHHSKFARPMKAELEDGFGLCEGLLEHRLMKRLPTFQRSGETFLDRMVSLYHERATMTELPSGTVRLLEQCKAYGLVPVFDDCRNAREADILASHDTVGVWVESDERGAMLTTDTRQYEIFTGCCNKHYHINNSGSLAELMRGVELLYQRKLSQWL